MIINACERSAIQGVKKTGTGPMFKVINTAKEESNPGNLANSNRNLGNNSNECYPLSIDSSKNSKRFRNSEVSSQLSENEERNFRFRNNSYHSEFILFRKALQLKKVLRKTRIDSLLKKCKSKVFKAVQEAINVLTGISNHKDNRLTQSFITNINIDFNKKYLAKTVEEIYIESKVFENLEELVTQSPMMKEEDKVLLRKLMNMTYKEIFESYVTSERYIRDFNYIKQREGEKYAILFHYVAKIYVKYFYGGKGNRKRNVRVNQRNRDVIIPKNVEKINRKFNLDSRNRLKLKKKFFATY